jgi:hypothetical protein
VIMLTGVNVRSLAASYWQEVDVDLGTMIDWAIFAGGIVGCVGTLVGWRVFWDEERMEATITRFGRRRVRVSMALVYLLFGLFGAYLVFMR